MITLEQYRKSLGSLADGLTDAELQQRLAYTYRFGQAFYEWWKIRKGSGKEAITGMYPYDIVLQETREHGRKPLFEDQWRDDVKPYVVRLDPEYVRAIQKYLWKIPNHLSQL